MSDPVAIIGIGCRFPQGIEDPADLWALLERRGDVISATPQGRPMPIAELAAAAGAPARAGYIEEVGGFDAAFFGISPREARSTDPQHRIFLETAWRAVEAANLPMEAVHGGRVGLFAALGGDDYLKWFYRYGADEGIDQHLATGNAVSTAAGRLAHALGLRGPAIAVDTACSSSAVAAHLACRALQSGDVDIAIAGGVNLILDPGPTIALSRAGMLSPDGLCKVFDAGADGYVRGEGCGVFVLRRLSDAVERGDPIRAVIRGSAINHDGRAASLTTPKGASQEEVIREALRNAGLATTDVDYVEAHGTGTSLGDMIEMSALHATYGRDRDGGDPCRVGAVKANLGHCESAAGAASLLKAILCLEHGAIPGQPHLAVANPHFREMPGAIAVPTDGVAWPAGRIRRAGVSSFGFSGTNAHLVLEAAPARRSGASAREPVLLVSAKSETALKAGITRNLERLARTSPDDLAEVAVASAVGRTHWRYRVAVSGADPEELSAALKRALKEAVAPSRSARQPVAFVFGGQGEQFPEMGRWSYENDSAFRRAFDECASAVEAVTGLQLERILYGDQTALLASSAEAIQFAIFAIQLGQVAAWRNLGVIPDVVSGHSLGEYAAAVVSGAHSLQDAVRLIRARAGIMSRLPETSGMIAVIGHPEQVRIAVEPEDLVDVAAFNSPSKTTVSGDSAALARVGARLKAEGCEVVDLPRVRAFHSPLLDPWLPDFGREVAGLQGQAPTVPWFSSGLGDWVEGVGLDSGFWSRHMRRPVQFDQAVQALIAAGAGIFVEIGPTSVLTGLARERLRDLDVLCIASGDRRRSGGAQWAASAAALHRHGHSIDWTAYYEGAQRAAVIPGYAFDRTSHWLDLPQAIPPRAADTVVPSPAPGTERSPLQDYYASLSRRHAEDDDAEGAFIRFAPLPTVVPGFSWLRTHARPDANDGHREVALAARAEMWRRFFAGLDLGSFSRIGDVGCGFGADVIRFAAENPTARVAGFNISADQVAFAGARAGRLGLKNAAFQVLDIGERRLPETFDLLLASQVFHHVQDKAAAIAHTAAGLAPGGYLVLAEILSALADPVGDETSTAYFETTQRWSELLAAESLRIQRVDDLSEGVANYLHDPDFEATLSEVAGDQDAVTQAHLRGPHQLGELLRRGVTRYLVVHAVKDAHADRRELVAFNRGRLNRDEQPAVVSGVQAVAGTAQELLRRALATVTGLSPRDLGDDVEVEALGLDSLMALEVRALLEAQLGIRLSMADLLEGRTLGELVARVESAAPAAISSATLKPADPAGDDHAPFPLTEIQQAYWIGRRTGLDLGGVAAHFYAEFQRDDWDLARLESAWNRVIERHPMLRAVVIGDDSQRVLETTPRYTIARHDLRALGAKACERKIAELRERLSHEVKDLRQWPPFSIEAALLPGGALRLFFGLDILFVDATSALRIGADWRRYYEDPGALLPRPALEFRDCLVSGPASGSPAARAAALDYWRERAGSLPAAPALPYRPAGADSGPPRFVRLAGRLSPHAWAQLKLLARSHRVTPSALLLTAYGAVLEQWSASPEFTIATTLYNREHPSRAIYDVVGDFTSINLTELRFAPGASFLESVRAVQSQLRRDLDHAAVSGVEVLREFNRLRAETERAAYPIVFTSALSERLSGDGPEAANWMSDAVYGITQTPQVLLDHSTYVVDGALCFHWDAPEGRFATGVLEAMFRAYEDLLQRLLVEEAWRQGLRPALPSDQIERRADYNATHVARAPQRLEEAFLAVAANTPDAIAVLSGDDTLTYGALSSRAAGVADGIISAADGQPGPVGILLPKGAGQAVAVLAALMSGRAYVPLDLDWPRDRLLRIAATARLAVLVTTAEVAASAGDLGLTVLDLSAFEGSPWRDRPICRAPDETAYVIFTSGSTGEPKGVEVAHRAAWNTIADINERFGVGPDDRLLGLSALTFDLSVYDLFGAWAAGAAVVIPDAGARRDPRHWWDLIRRHGVTIWNSVPALMGLLLEHLAGEPQARSTVRLAMLSGDWVPLTMADEVRERLGQVSVVALGGATEAAIWSILFEVEKLEPAWTSVPYGRPMQNQQLDVVGPDLTSRPEWAVGEIVVRGEGLASGYCGDPVQTAERFVVDPKTGVRSYRTGDLGRMLPGKLIEFLGRADGQVKIRGHRVELGEIESAALRHPAVRHAVAGLGRDHTGATRLVLWVQADPIESVSLGDTLAAILPQYMRPARILCVGSFELSANGKVDRTRLPQPEWNQAAGHVDHNPDWQRFAEIWASLLGAPPASTDEDFLQRGGDSLLLTRLLLKVRDTFDVDLGIEEVFEAPRAGAVFELITDRRNNASPGNEAWRPLSTAQASGWDRLGPTATASRCIFAALNLPSSIDPADLRRAIAGLADRHEAIRLRFRDGAPARQSVCAALHLEAAVVEGLQNASTEDVLAHLLACAEPLDGRDRVLAARLARTREGLVLILQGHPLALDVRSLELICTDLRRAISPTANPTDAETSCGTAALQPYVAAYEDWLASGVVAEQEEFWRTQLERLTKVAAIGTSVVPSAAITAEGIAGASRAFETSLSGLLLGALQDVAPARAFAVAVNGRLTDSAEGLAGPFGNVVLVEAAPRKGRVADRMRKARDCLADALEHRDEPLGAVVARLAPGADPAGLCPLGLIVLDAEPDAGTPELLAPATLIAPVTIIARAVGADVRLRALYDPDTATSGEVEQILSALHRRLARLVATRSGDLERGIAP